MLSCLHPHIRYASRDNDHQCVLAVRTLVMRLLQTDVGPDHAQCYVVRLDRASHTGAGTQMNAAVMRNTCAGEMR